jgi:hypothetical protein
VLTARSVASPGRDVLAVSFPGREAGGAERYSCVRLWVSADDDIDAALLEIDDSLWPSASVRAPLRWGKFTGGLAWRAATIMAQHPVPAEVNPLNRRHPYRWDLRLPGDPPDADATGAALFTGELLTGIAVGDPAACVPVSAAASATDFLACIEAAQRRPLHLEPVELDGAIQRRSAANDPRTPADLLDPARAIAPFHGRPDAVRRLMDWCGTSAPLAGRLLTGTAGIGKSRLAGELSRALVDQGWLVVELSVTRLPTHALNHLELVDRPVLVVADDLDSDPESAKAVVEHLVRHGPRSRVRLLMLARTAGHWWYRWRADLGDQAVVTAEPDSLDAPTVEAGEPDWVEVAAAFATHLDGVVPSAPPTGAVDSTPLATGIGILAALLADPARPGVPSEDVLIDRAFSDWERAAHTLQADTRRYWRDCIEVATVCQPADRAEALGVLAGVPGLDGDANLSTRQELADHLRALFPPRDPGLFWGHPLPAGLRDHYLAGVTAPPAWLPAIGRLRPPGRIEAALVVLAETAIRSELMANALSVLILGDIEGLGPATVAAASRSDAATVLLAGLAAAVGREALTSETCERLLRAVPVQAGALASFAVTLRQRVVRDLQAQKDRVPGAGLRLTEQLTALAGEMAAAGDLDGGLLVARQAVDAASELTALRPVDIAVPQVLAALRTQARLLREADRVPEAIEVAIAEAMRCRVEARADSVYLPRLADTLAFLGELCLANGDAGRASSAIDEALAHYRGSAQAHPAILARTLCLLSDAQFAAGAPSAAAASLGEAVLLFRDLADAHPYGYLQRFAATSGVLAERLWAAGEAQAAAAAAERAVEVYRRFAAAHTDGYLPELTHALCRRSDLLAATGRGEEALAAAQQALLGTRGVPELIPLRELTAALHTVLRRHLEHGDRKRSVEIAVELVAVHRRAVEQGRLDLRPALAQALANLSALLGAAGQLAQSRLAAEEAVALLPAEMSGRYARARAAALNNRAIVLGEVGAAGDLDAVARAVEDAEAATEILAGMAGIDDLARALATLSARRAAAGDLEGSVEVAVRLVDVHHEGDQIAYAAALYILAERYLAVGEWEAAGETIDRCRSVYDEIRRLRPESLRAEAAESSMLIARLPSGHRPHGRVIAAVRHAVALYRELVVDDEAALEALAESEETLARLLEADGQPTAAIDASRHAVATRASLAADGSPHDLALLAVALDAHARRLADAGAGSAISVARDAVATARRIRDPALRNPAHAAAAHLLSTLLDGSVGPDIVEALTHATTAVTLYRRLAEDDPDQYLVHLAHALDGRARRHGKVGNLARRAADAAEAVKVHRMVARKRPQHRPVFADALVKLAAVTPVEDTDARRQIYEEVVATYESLEAHHSGLYTAHLINALTRLIDILAQSGRRHRADRDRRRRQAEALEARLRMSGVQASPATS